MPAELTATPDLFVLMLRMLILIHAVLIDMLVEICDMFVLMDFVFTPI